MHTTAQHTVGAAGWFDDLATASVPLQEFVVTGQQRLSELRDVLACPADLNFRALGVGVPSAYFYIEGAFYNDRRHPDSKNYAAPIIRCVSEF